MTGLILSKAALSYQHFAEQSRIEDLRDWWVTECLDDVLSADDLRRASVRWLLAEPSLALAVLPYLPNLVWLQSTWAGVEVLLAPSLRRDYTLTNIRGIFAPLMSEYVLAHCLAHERRLLAHEAAKREKRWLNEHNGVLRGKTLLIMGVGSIGMGIAQAARFFGMRVLGVVGTARPMSDVDEVGTFVDLPTLLPRADYVVNVLPNTPATQNVVDARFLSLMKSSAVFMNVGRGQAVIEADLAAALSNGIISAAVLDVYREEPLPEHHVFWDTPNLTLTSHTAAPSFPEEVFGVFAENHRRFVAGEDLMYQVSFERGY
ncbi:2-hydroxyacid dehydrogenase [Formosimonas limnophila]|uniref:2-hydroxyacid dehydrogenase n=1 Tax=Formosimonas limnophila TaxID=1384487 RepID=A0A8J3FZM2_9BURK|nr:D-2-hydroxyacid dehydrogenase [Formosimonas limnophila]GHA70062.1 2-hydroxyacid dehydrogenase [Formosimonas limnophila]